jgi:putative spermidine/putrescine transport system ATP-binding protein
MGADNIIPLAIRPADGLLEATFTTGEGERSVARLPVGDGGVHLGGAAREGAVEAYFRGESVRLLGPAEPVPAESLGLPGTVTQVSYPGGVWRYSVQSGARRFVIDAERRFGVGEAVRVILPANALHLFPAAA